MSVAQKDNTVTIAMIGRSILLLPEAVHASSGIQVKKEKVRLIIGCLSRKNENTH